MFKDLFRTVKGCGNSNNHEFVDMGLPSGNLWSIENVGTDDSNPTGRYFSWGDTVTKKSYSFDKFNRAIRYMLSSETDVASAWWGGKWLTPTVADYKELFQNSLRSWSEEKKGLILKSKINGNTLFFPASGEMILDSPAFYGSEGNYWTSQAPVGEKYNLSQSSNCAMAVSFGFDHIQIDPLTRGFGLNVRGILKKK